MTFGNDGRAFDLEGLYARNAIKSRRNYDDDPPLLGPIATMSAYTRREKNEKAKPAPSRRAELRRKQKQRIATNRTTVKKTAASKSIRELTTTENETSNNAARPTL